MKVSNQKDAVELSHLARSKKGEKTGKAKEHEAASSPVGDLGNTSNVEISSEAKALANAKKVAGADDVNQEKVDRVKAMINGGTYKPDMGKVADKMINEHLLQDLS